MLFAAVALLVICIAAFWSGLTVRHYNEISPKLSATVRLVVLTDLHGTIFGRGQKSLIRLIAEQAPDAILLAGDIIDEEFSWKGSELLLSAIGKNYPCYYAAGNHEFRSLMPDVIKDMIRSYGVAVLEGEAAVLSVSGQNICLCGVDDPSGFAGSYGGAKGENWELQLDSCKKSLEDDIYSVLISHRPELVEQYESSGFDLVTAGHAHGGQARIPGLLNGLFAPNQGLFPKYAGGRYQLGDTAMIVSRGLSRKRFPRIFNPPELVVVDLCPKKQD